MGGKRKASAFKRFMFNANIESFAACWEWSGAINQLGYGRFTDNYINQGAHRWSFQFFKGPIPEGLWICHACDNPSCVNPDHLWAGTAQQNAQDMHAKGRNFMGPNWMTVFREYEVRRENRTGERRDF